MLCGEADQTPQHCLESCSLYQQEGQYNLAPKHLKYEKLVVETISVHCSMV